MVPSFPDRDAKGQQKGRKGVAPQFQEELGLFPENQYICFPLISLAFNIFFDHFSPGEEADFWTRFSCLHSLSNDKACAVSDSVLVLLAVQTQAGREPPSGLDLMGLDLGEGLVN